MEILKKERVSDLVMSAKNRDNRRAIVTFRLNGTTRAVVANDRRFERDQEDRVGRRPDQTKNGVTDN
jgi:hypothetical protein